MAAAKPGLLSTEKEFYELKVKSLNERIDRIKQRCNDLEKDNTEVKKQYKNLEEESADIISYLKRSITQKHEEIKVVTDRLQALQSTKATEKDKYQEQITILEKDYKTMHDTFTAEVKLLSGQLSSLESFKNNREAMVKKLISLEDELKKKDEHHALALRNNENKYILMKEKLSAYVEERLLKLSLDLQKKTQSKVAESTQNIIKENIAINNELNLIIGSWQKIFDENEALKEKNKNLKHEFEIANELKDKVMEKNYILNQIIERLNVGQQKNQEKFKHFEEHVLELQNQLDESLKSVELARQRVQELEALNVAMASELDELKNEHQLVKSLNCKMESVIKKAVIKIQEVIGLQEDKTEKSITDEDEFTLRRQLLNSLLDLFDTFALFKEKVSVEDNIEILSSEEDYEWIKRSPVLKKCAYIKKIKEMNSYIESQNINCE